MDHRDIESIRDTATLDRVLQRTKPAKQISDIDRWGPWIAAIVIVSFAIWVLGVSIQQDAFDAVNVTQGSP